MQGKSTLPIKLGAVGAGLGLLTGWIARPVVMFGQKLPFDVYLNSLTSSHSIDQKMVTDITGQVILYLVIGAIIGAVVGHFLHTKQPNSNSSS